MKAFFKSQFSYFRHVWICHSRSKNGKINRLNERCLRIIYSDKLSSFEKPLEKCGSIFAHNWNLQSLATEMNKIHNEISPLIVTGLFEQRNGQHWDLIKNSQFTKPPIGTVFQGSKNFSFLGPKIWNILPNRLKNANSIEAFKMQIRKWKAENCPCLLCKVYVRNVGFV